MNRMTGLIAATFAGVAASAPAAAFQFENGTTWPLAVGINGGPTQVVPPEEVTFLNRGQCNTGCVVNITINDPSRPQSAINGDGGEPPTIGANGDQAIVRVRQERGGVTVEVVSDQGAVPPVQATDAQPSTVQPLPPQPPALQAPPQTPAVSPPPANTPAPAAPTPSTTIIPPPPAPDYDAN